MARDRELQNNDIDGINFHNERPLLPSMLPLFGNHPARRLRFGIHIGSLTASLCIPGFFPSQREVGGDSSFESFSARRIASFRRIFYKLGHFAKPFRCAGSLARMPRITVPYITNAQQLEGGRRR